MRSLARLLYLVLLITLAALECSGRGSEIVRPGDWGGMRIGMQVGRAQTSIEFDCARGRIDQSITLDSQGHFDVPGIYIEEHGGPMMQGEPLVTRRAHYAGQVRGKTMGVTVTLDDTMETIGKFTLTRGQPSNVFKCL